MEHATDNNIAYFIGVLVSVLAIVIVSTPIARWLHVPHSFLLIAVGFLGSELLVSQGVDTGIRWTNFHDLIFYVFLPALVFDAAFRMKIDHFINNIFPIMVLAVPLLLAAILIGGAVIYFMIGNAQGFPWIAALLAAVVIAPTDPTAVASVAQRCRLPARVKILIEGESLLNDATALILFLIIMTIGLEIAAGKFVEIPYWSGIFSFLLVFFGGSALGTLIALPGILLIRKLRDPNVQAAITVLSAYGAYLLASYDKISVSGIMAVLTCGILMGAYARRDDNKDIGDSLSRIWSFIAYISESAIFLLAGITITFGVFTEQWLAMLIGIVAALVSRAVIVYGSFPLFNMTTYKSKPLRFGEQSMVVLGGVRGAFTMALALSLPLSLDYWFTIQAIAYGVVLFTLLTQTSALETLGKRASPSEEDK